MSNHTVECCNIIFSCLSQLTHSLPRDVHTRRKNDRAVAKDVYIRPTWISFYASVKAGPSTWWLLHVSELCFRQFFHRCLLSWVLFIEKRVHLYFLLFLSKWWERAWWMFPDPTQAGTPSWTFDVMAFVTTVIEERSGFIRLTARSTGMTVEIGWESEPVTGSPGGKNDRTARCERRPRYSNWWTLVFVERPSVRMCKNLRGWNIASQLSGAWELQRGSAASKLVNNNHTLEWLSKVKKIPHIHRRCSLCSVDGPVRILTSGVKAGTQAVTEAGAFAFKQRENRNFGPPYVTLGRHMSGLRYFLITWYCTSTSSNNERPIPSFRIWNSIAKNVGQRGGCLWKGPIAVNGLRREKIALQTISLFLFVAPFVRDCSCPTLHPATHNFFCF